MDDLILMTPNPERAKGILKQVEVRLELIAQWKKEKYATLIIEAQYEVIKELLTALLAIEGYKTLSHMALIDYLNKNPHGITKDQIFAIDDLRKMRNRIAYEGFMVTEDYLNRRSPTAKIIIAKLRTIIEAQIKSMP